MIPPKCSPAQTEIVAAELEGIDHVNIGTQSLDAAVAAFSEWSA